MKEALIDQLEDSFSSSLDGLVEDILRTGISNGPNGVTDHIPTRK